MPDIYAEIRAADRDTQGMLADAMITRAADGALTAMRRQYFDWLGLPPGARVAEIGCGPGDITRDLKAATGAAEAVGIDPSPVMIERANQRHGDDPALGFVEGTGAIFRWRTARATRSSFTPACAMSPGRTARSPRPGAS